MVKLMRSKKTGNLHLIEIEQGKIRQNKIVSDISEAKTLKKKWAKNQYKRLENQMLRDICGTSARQARIDMGL
jgi:hypothetical protein